MFKEDAIVKRKDNGVICLISGQLTGKVCKMHDTNKKLIHVLCGCVWEDDDGFTEPETVLLAVEDLELVEE